MGMQRVMDHTGDTPFRFDPANATELAAAEERFRQLTGSGFIAAEKTGDGTSKLVKAFDPNAEETVFHPQLVGG
jgi:hypothetical protein